jgi:hypothetical protein
LAGIAHHAFVVLTTYAPAGSLGASRGKRGRCFVRRAPPSRNSYPRGAFGGIISPVDHPKHDRVLSRGRHENDGTRVPADATPSKYRPGNGAPIAPRTPRAATARAARRKVNAHSSLRTSVAERQTGRGASPSAAKPVEGSPKPTTPRTAAATADNPPGPFFQRPVGPRTQRSKLSRTHEPVERPGNPSRRREMRPRRVLVS